MLQAPQNISCHWHDGGNNSFSALRVIAPKTGDLMYAEFVDGHNPTSHFFPSDVGAPPPFPHTATASRTPPL